MAERYLMATGKTLYSMVAQVTGAVLNIVLDYVFIFPLKMSVAGAAWATVIGQVASFMLALVFHFAKNKELTNHPKYVLPRGEIIKKIYKLDFPAFLMQGMLAFMMFGVLLIIGTVPDDYTVNLLSGSYGIHYKLMQIALFAAFGLSNTLISLTSYNFGMKNCDRVKQIIKYGIADSVVVAAVLTLVYQVLAAPISQLFALTLEESSIVSKSDVIGTCQLALHVATIGYVFMGVSVAIQGVLQGFNEVYSPLIISALRLIVLVLPIAYLFTLSQNVPQLIWWTFPIAEVVTSVVSVLFLKSSVRKHLGSAELVETIDTLQV